MRRKEGLRTEADPAKRTKDFEPVVQCYWISSNVTRQCKLANHAQVLRLEPCAALSVGSERRSPGRPRALPGSVRGSQTNSGRRWYAARGRPKVKKPGSLDPTSYYNNPH